MSDVSRQKLIHWNALPDDVRTRLKEVFEGTGEPSPILADRSSLGWDLAGWITLLVCSLGALFMLFTWGFGETHDEWAIQGLFFIPVYLGLFWLSAWSCLRMVRRVQLQNRMPFPPGRYLLPNDFIDATSAELRIIPLNDLADFSGTHHHTNGAYTHTELSFSFVGGHAESFTVHGRDLAEQVLSEIGSTGRVIAAAAEANDIGVIAAMDPLLEAKLDSGNWEAMNGAGAPIIAPQAGPTTRPVAMPFRKAAAVAVVAAVLIGMPAQLVRNVVSDQIMYSSVQSTTSTWECESYLRNGWLHTDEVMTTLLPAAAFRDATSKHTVEAMRNFLKEYPGSAHEVEATSKIHEYYVQALEDFKGHASEDNPEAVPFMSELLTWLETHGDPDVDVRFDPPATAALTEMDKLLNDPAEKVWDGPIAPVANNFSDRKSKVRESSITKMLQKGFEQVFPNDVLTLAEGERLVEADWDKPVDKPTILVSYAVGPSGTVYTSDDSDRGYVGIYVTFYVQMKIPGSERTIDFDLEVEPPEVFTVGGGYLSYLVNTDSNSSSSDDANVYDTMALRAFDELGIGVRRVFFKAGVGDVSFEPPAIRPSLGELGGGLSPADMEALLKMLENDGL